jgi:valyl-tRNA synthetase
MARPFLGRVFLCPFSALSALSVEVGSMTLEGRYDHRGVEPRLQQRWADLGIYRFDARAAAPLFSVDTPPPTVSGQIHIGHVYSYTQADIMARYRRMRGHTVFYPFGFDDNGLPTERFTEQARGISARAVGREPFIRACLELSGEVERRFERFWKRLGLSVDWRLRYSTIDDRSRRIAQGSFIDLYERGHVERREAPTLWCPHCQTAVAQADVDDRDDVPTTFVTLAFPTVDGRQIRIATTRPELLPACVAVFVHPDDQRYVDLIGATAIVPIFGLQVPILANPEAQPAKGTGAVMCCTFGDVSDVRWWHTYRLPLRVAIRPDGTMDEIAGPYAGALIAQARARIIADLQAQGLALESAHTTHTIGVHERCGTPIEYLVSGQWFIGVLALREQLLEAGRRILWHPAYMHARYESWVEGLSWDWNISRQRYYGVPFPLWYCADCGAVLLAVRDRLPIDPTTSQPDTPCAACRSTTFRPETDVMDTWATSSLTPRICASLAAEHGLDEEAFLAHPLSLRPNAHDIIRTWDFYTIVQSLLHRGEIPWRELMIAGHAQDPSGRKLSKSKLQAADDPTNTIEQFSADAVRYWTAGVRMGGDTALSADAFRQGNRLITKLWNAARFVLQSSRFPAESQSHVPDAAAQPRTLSASDRWLLARLGQTVARATAAMEDYEPAGARAAIERFFWSDLCDTYLELVKYRLSGRDLPDGTTATPGERAAAMHTLRTALRGVLALLAPFLPHVTEEIYLQGGFAEEEGSTSIHVAPWPDAAMFAADREALDAGQTMLAIIEETRRWKAERSLSVATPILMLAITCPAAQLPLLREMRLDLACIARATTIAVSAGEEVSTAINAQERGTDGSVGGANNASI